jgi:hypothetical protein
MSAAGGHVDAVRLLLNKNASPIMLNSYKKSALDMALDYEQVDAAVTMMKHKKYEHLSRYVKPLLFINTTQKHLKFHL